MEALPLEMLEHLFRQCGWVARRLLGSASRGLLAAWAALAPDAWRNAEPGASAELFQAYACFLCRCGYLRLCRDASFGLRVIRAAEGALFEVSYPEFPAARGENGPSLAYRPGAGCPSWGGGVGWSPAPYAARTRGPALCPASASAAYLSESGYSSWTGLSAWAGRSSGFCEAFARKSPLLCSGPDDVCRAWSCKPETRLRFPLNWELHLAFEEERAGALLVTAEIDQASWLAEFTRYMVALSPLLAAQTPETIRRVIGAPNRPLSAQVWLPGVSASFPGVSAPREEAAPPPKEPLEELPPPEEAPRLAALLHGDGLPREMGPPTDGARLRAAVQLALLAPERLEREMLDSACIDNAVARCYREGRRRGADWVPGVRRLHELGARTPYGLALHIWRAMDESKQALTTLELSSAYLEDEDDASSVAEALERCPLADGAWQRSLPLHERILRFPSLIRRIAAAGRLDLGPLLAAAIERGELGAVRALVRGGACVAAGHVAQALRVCRSKPAEEAAFYLAHRVAEAL